MFILIVRAIWSMHNKLPYASWSYIHYRDRIRKACRAPPMFNMFWTCPYFPNKFYWRFDNSFIPLSFFRKFPFFFFCIFSCFCFYFFLLAYFLVLVVFVFFPCLPAGRVCNSSR